MGSAVDDEEVTSKSPVEDGFEDMSGDVTTLVSDTEELTTVSAIVDEDVSIDLTTPVYDTEEVKSSTSPIEDVSDDATTVSSDEALDVTTASPIKEADVTTVSGIEDETSGTQEFTTSEAVIDDAIDVTTPESETKDSETTIVEDESVDVTTVETVESVSNEEDVDVTTKAAVTSIEVTTVNDEEVLIATTETVSENKDDTTISTDIQDTEGTSEIEETGTGVPALDDPTTTVKSEEDEIEETTPEKLPRFDDPETTPLIIEVEPVTTDSSIDSLSLVTDKEMTTLAESEETTKADPSLVTVVTVEEDDDIVTIVTMRPTTGFTEDDIPTASGVDTAITSTTTMQSITEDEITTAPADQQFLCSQTEAVIENNEDVPMECTHMDGDEEKTVLLIIPRDSLGDITLDRLFDKNVKIIVKDFMIMDRSPRRL